MKRKIIGFIMGVALLIGIGVALQQPQNLQAKNNTEQKVQGPQPLAQTRALEPQLNGDGFGATAKVQTIAYAATGNIGNASANFVTDIKYPTGTTAANWTVTYQWVDEAGNPVANPTKDKVGFQWIYLEMTATPRTAAVWDGPITSIIKIPMNITGTAMGTTVPPIYTQVKRIGGTDVMIANDSSNLANIVFNLNEVRGKKTEKELCELIEKKISAWETETGKPVLVKVSETTLPTKGYDNNAYTATVLVENEGETYTIKQPVRVYGVAEPKVYKTSNSTPPANQQQVNLMFQLSLGGNLSYQWVENIEGDPTTPENKLTVDNGAFKLGYLKIQFPMSPLYYVVQVPVNMTTNGTVFSDDDKAAFRNVPEYPPISIEEMYNQSEFQPDIGQTVAEKALEVLNLPAKNLDNTIAWDTQTGEVLSATLGTTIEPEGVFSPLPVLGPSVITSKGEKVVYPSLRVPVYPKEAILIGANRYSAKNALEAGSIDNPVTASRAAFNETVYVAGEATGVFVPVIKPGDDNFSNEFLKSNILYDGDSWVPFIDNKVLDNLARKKDFHFKEGDPYSVVSLGNQNGKFYGSNWNDAINDAKQGTRPLFPAFYFKSQDGRTMRAVSADPLNNVFYWYDIVLKPNLYYEIMLYMYNADSQTHDFSFLTVSTVRYPSTVSDAFSLGNNAGFSLKPSPLMNTGWGTTIVKYKNEKGEWLSSFTKYKVAQVDGNNKNLAVNFFGNRFEKDGDENRNLSYGDILYEAKDYSISLIESGAAPRKIAPGESLKVGYQVYAGNELPLMIFSSEPEQVNIYDNFDKNLPIKYKLSNIPNFPEDQESEGTISVKYPECEPEVIAHYKAISEFSGTWNMERSKLPASLLEEWEDKHTYEIPMYAVNETEPYKDYPSEDYAIGLNVYRLTATPVGQTINKGETWARPAETVVTDAKFIEGHDEKITYDYVDADGKVIDKLADVVDTSKVGLQWVDIKMTDTDSDVGSSTIIKVPITVLGDETTIDESDELVIYAKDFETTPQAVEGMEKADLDTFILTQSDAKSWLVSNGEKVTDIQVESTDFTNDPDPAKDYTATIMAKANGLTVKKTIKITLISGQLEVKVPDDLTFKSVTLPIVSAQSEEEIIIPRSEADTRWGITVTDTHTKPDTWTLQAALTRPFQTKQGAEVKDLLIFQPETGDSVMMAENANVPIYTQTAPQNGVTTIDWEKDFGFLLQLDPKRANDTIKKGSYTAEITFTFADDAI